MEWNVLENTEQSKYGTLSRGGAEGRGCTSHLL